jgi:hypothetical protein
MVARRDTCSVQSNKVRNLSELKIRYAENLFEHAEMFFYKVALSMHGVPK